MSTAIANQLFLAYLGRAADVQWQSITGNTLNSAAPSVAMQTAFYNAAIADGRFAASDTPSVLVNKIFQNLFGFGASAFEQTQWGNLISNGTISAATAAWTIFSSYLGATNVPTTYQQPVQSKLIALEAYTRELERNPTANAAYSVAGSTAAASGRTFLDGVTSQATAASSISNVATTVSTGAVASGSSFSLTTNLDTVTGTAGNDTIFGTDTTFTTGDQINGGAGTDTLSLIFTGANSAIATSSAVEVVRIQDRAAGNSISLANFTGVTTLEFVSSLNDNSGNATTFTNVNASAATINLRDLGTANGKHAVTYADTSLSGTADAVSIGLNNVTAAQTLTVQTASTASGIETLNIAATGSNSTAAVTLVSALQTGVTRQTVNVTGDKNASLVLSTGQLTVNASTYTGNLTLDVSASANYTVTGGSGNDRFVFAGNFDANDRVAGGAGTDTLATSTATVNTAFANIIDGTTNGVANNSGIEVLDYTGTAAYTLDASLIQMSTLTTYRTSGVIAGTAAPTAADPGTAATVVGWAVTGQSNAQTFVVAANITGGAGGAASSGNNNGGAATAAATFAPNVDNGSNVLNLTLNGVTLAGGAGGNAQGSGTGGAGGAAISATAFETINIVSSGTATNTLTGGAGGTGGTAGAAGAGLAVSSNAVINISGDRAINLGTIGSSNNPVTVNASSLTGALTVTTGTGSDTITGGSGVNSVTLSGGVDAVILSASSARADSVISSAFTGTTSTQFIQITGFTNAATTGDRLDVAGTAVVLADISSGQTSGVTNLTFGVTNGVLSFGGSAAASATLANKVTAAFSANAINNNNNRVVAFEHNGSTYIASSQDTTQGFNAGTDGLIQLVGVTGVTALSLTADRKSVV